MYEFIDIQNVFKGILTLDRYVLSSIIWINGNIIET